MATAIDELCREIHKQGYETEKGRDGHFRVLKDGEPVREPGGKPIRFAGTPTRGKARAIANAVGKLRRAGVLPRPAEANGNGNGRALNGPRSDELRPQLEALMTEYGLRQSDVSAFADLLASVRLQAVPSYGQGVISKFLKGGSLSDPNLAWLGGAIDEIAEAGGIPEPEPEAEPEPPPAVAPEPAPEPPPAKRDRRERRPAVPSLALDVMQALYAEGRDDKAIRALVERVAELEMSQ